MLLPPTRATVCQRRHSLQGRREPEFRSNAADSRRIAIPQQIDEFLNPLRQRGIPVKHHRSLDPSLTCRVMDAPEINRLFRKHKREDSNPIRRFWRLTALPGARLYESLVKKVTGGNRTAARQIHTLPPDSRTGPSHSGRRGIRTLKARRPRGLANRPGEPYPAAFRECVGTELNRHSPKGEWVTAT